MAEHEWVLGQPVETQVDHEWVGGQPHVVVEGQAETLEFTGTLTPDSTGEFVETGVYAEKPYYYNAAKGYYLFWNIYTSRWVVDDVLGSQGQYHWLSEEKLDYYEPGGEALGIGNMHVKVTQTILNYERIARGVNRGVLVGMA